MKFVAVAMAAVCVAGAATSAFADSTVTMTFTGTGGATEPTTGGQSVYVYPYDFTVNGTVNTTLMCISYDNEITQPETWMATESQLSKTSSPTVDLEEAYLFSLISSTTNSNTIADIQFADWYLSDSTAVEATKFYIDNTSAIQSYINQAETTGIDESASFYLNFDVYTPVADTQSTGGTPQTFIGDPVPAATPEPGSLALLGTSLLGMGGLVRRRLQKA